MEPIVEVMERWPGYAEQSWRQRFAELDRRLHITQDRFMAAMIGRLSTPSPDLKADNAALVEWATALEARCNASFKATGDHGVGCAREVYRKLLKKLQATEPRP